MRADSVEAAEKWRAINAVRGLARFKNGLEESNAKDAQALAVCLEALAEHAHDSGSLLREVNPKAYAPTEILAACVESLAAYAHGGEWAPPKPIDTTKSAPPLTPEERMR